MSHVVSRLFRTGYPKVQYNGLGVLIDPSKYLDFEFHRRHDAGT